MDPRLLRPSLVGLLVLVGVAGVLNLPGRGRGPRDVAAGAVRDGSLSGAAGLPDPSLQPSFDPGFTLGPSAGPASGPSIAPLIGGSPNPAASWFPNASPSAKPTPSPFLKPTPAPTSTPKPKPTGPAPTPKPAPTPAPAACTLFPSTNVWNKDVSTLPVRADSATLVGSIGLTSVLHPDFSSMAYNGGLGYGIPFNKVNSSTPRYPVAFDYADESDPGPYPIPAKPKIETGSDAHMLLWDTQSCDLYELYAAAGSGSHWTAGSGAIWDLRSNALRPNGWTSADAAGLPILPGLVRYEEVAAGAIRHALRFTAPRTCAAHIYPARHDAGSWPCTTYPPMGLRVRLKSSVDISGFGSQARVILTALKKYGMILADNGSPWYVTGAPNASWNDDQLHVLQTLHGSDFEAVDTSTLRNG